MEKQFLLLAVSLGTPWIPLALGKRLMLLRSKTGPLNLPVHLMLSETVPLRPHYLGFDPSRWSGMKSVPMQFLIPHRIAFALQVVLPRFGFSPHFVLLGFPNLAGFFVPASLGWTELG